MPTNDRAKTRYDAAIATLRSAEGQLKTAQSSGARPKPKAAPKESRSEGASARPPEDEGIGGFFHAALDVIGLVPFFGEPADLVNAAIYAAEGDLVNAGISAASAVPGPGTLVGVAKLGTKYGDEVIGFASSHVDEGVSLSTKSADDVTAAGTSVQRNGDNLPTYHRLESPTQTPATAARQQASGEIWGGTGRYGVTPSIRAYSGPLPPGARGIEFQTSVRPDAGGAPGLPTWRGPRPGVEIRGEFAVICVVVTRNTQC